MAATKNKTLRKRNANEPVFKRTRNKINSLACVLQLEHSLYQDDTVMRFAAISDQINTVDKKIEGLRLDMQAAIHNEFMYLVQKMLLSKQQLLNKSSNSVEIDYGGRR